MNPPDIDQFIKDTLDGSPLEDSTRQRLDAMRHAALAADTRPVFARFAWPAMALASFAIVAVTLSLVLRSAEPAVDDHAIESFEIMTSSDDLEMYQELEFYLWLDEELNS